MQSKSELIEFFHILPNAPMPAPADPALDGSISTRAFKFCEPFTAANGCGWYLFPPFDFDLKWDGHTCLWRRTVTGADWKLLHTEVPEEFSRSLQTLATQMGSKHYGNLPFMSHTPEYGIIQMWSGLIVKTKAGWSSLVRPLVNYPHEAAIEVFDGIIETDWWMGPLFTVFRVTKSDVVIEFRRNKPYAHLQVIKKEAYARSTMTNYGSYAGVTQWPQDASREFIQTLSGFSQRHKPGNYKRSVRERAASGLEESVEGDSCEATAPA